MKPFLVCSSLCQVRVDSGIQEGSDISIYYDPMISKVSDVLNILGFVSDVFLIFGNRWSPPES